MCSAVVSAFTVDSTKLRLLTAGGWVALQTILPRHLKSWEEVQVVYKLESEVHGRI